VCCLSQGPKQGSVVQAWVPLHTQQAGACKPLQDYNVYTIGHRQSLLVQVF
jgi:hypothetical protein